MQNAPIFEIYGLSMRNDYLQRKEVASVKSRICDRPQLPDSQSVGGRIIDRLGILVMTLFF